MLISSHLVCVCVCVCVYVCVCVCVCVCVQACLYVAISSHHIYHRFTEHLFLRDQICVRAFIYISMCSENRHTNNNHTYMHAGIQ